MFWNKNKNVSTRSSAAPIRSPLALSLEPRMLFDGAVAATVADAATTTADAAQAQSADDSSQHATEAVIPPAASSDQRQEVVFIDGKLADKQQLIDGLKPGTEVVVLDSSTDGLQQIADYLEGREGIDAIHIFSHGQQGLITLGDFKLDQAALTDQAATLARIGNVLSEDGDILLYGCNVAEGDKGNTFISKLALATSADIAASTDVTGSSALGGNWVLEARTGTVIEDSPLTDQGMTDFSSTLQQLVNGGADGTVGWDSIVSNATVAGAITGMTGGQIIFVTDHLGSGFDIYSKNDSDAGSSNFTIRNQIMGMTGSSGAPFVRVGTITAMTPEWLELRANQGIFDLTSIKVGSGDTLTAGTYSFTLQALDSAFNPMGTAVTLNNVTVSNFGTFSVSGNTDFDGIYGVRITVDKGTQIAVDDIEVTNPRMPSAPPVATTSGGTTAFTEGNNITSMPVAIDSGITLADSDSSTLASATVSITGNFQSSQDMLAFTNNPATMGNITASYNSGTGVLSLSSAGATATVAQWQAAMRSVTYTNSSDTPSTSNRTISFVVNDGTGDSNSATKTVSITSVNDAPVTSASGGTTAFTEGNNVTSTPVVVDSAITISDPDNSTLSNAKVSITGNFQTTEDLLAFTNNPATMGNIAASYNASTGELSLTSAGATATLAQWQAALRSVTYTNSSDTPNTSNRTISFVVNDGASDGNTTTKTVSVASVNDTPIATTSGGTTAFTEGNTVASTPVVIDSGITISDVDSTTLSTATVSITGNLHTGEDVLAFTNNPATMGNITASYNAGTGVMTLTSAGATATLAQWQAALRSVTYTNSSDNPDTNNRTISFVANDGSTSSSAATKIVSVTAVNEAPQVTVPATMSVTEDVSSAITGISFSDVDAGSSSVTVTLSVTSGSLAATSGGGGGVTIGGTSSALTLTGSISNINTFIAGSNVSFTTAANSTADVTLTASINDGGNTGSGGAQTGSETVTLQVVAVNDAPVITAPPSIAIFEDEPGDLSGISFSDVDAGTSPVTVTLSVPSGSLSATSAAGVTVGGTSSAMTLTGSISDINTFISAAGVVFTTASSVTSDVTLTIEINDGGNSGSGGALTDSTTLTLDVTAVNDAPVNSIPAAQSVDQDASLVFSNGNGNQISIGDVDAGANSVEVTLSVTNGVLTLAGTAGLSFTTGDGTADSSLVFSGSITDINAALATLTYSPTSGYNGAAVLSITTSDLGSSGSGGTQTDTDNVNITVNSLNPRITDVSASTPDGSYKVGDTITITTTFNQAVTVDTTGDTPTLLLETGLTDRIATYVSGSGSNTLTFSYTVQPGDLSADLDYQSTAALSLNGATIQNITADNAVLTLPTPGTAGSLAANETIVIDGVAATVSSVSVPANGVYVAGDNLDFTVNLSENVTVDTSGGTPRIAITLDTGGTAYASYLSGSGTSALVFRLTVASGQMDSNGISLGSSIDANGGNLRDTAGNNSTTTLNAVGSTTGVLVDAVAPQINAISLDAASPTNASSVTFTVTFSEDVSGVDIGDFSLATSGSVNATLQSLTQIDPRTYQVTVDTITGLGSLGLNATGAGIIDNASNLISNAFTGQTYTIDSLRPSASIVVADTALAAGETSTVTITFNEAVSGLTSADFTVANGVLSGLSSGDGGITWTAIFTPTASVENTSNVITLDNTGYTDLAGNAGTGSTDSNNYAVDTAQALVIENGDPEFRANPPSQPPALPPAPLQPTTPVPSPSTTQSPLIPPPLFEIPTIGSGIPTLGNIFINQNALAPSYIAQVFASSSNDIGGDGSGSGFLGFGGGDGGVFGSSSLSNIFGQDSQQETEQLEVFDGKKWGSTEGSRPGTFGAPTLSQQLHELHEVEQRQVRGLAQALGQLESVQTQA